MTYDEAIKLAHEWTKGHDLSLDGWRSVIAILLARNTALEANTANLTQAIHRLQRENESLSMDLGIKNKDFVLSTEKKS